MNKVLPKNTSLRKGIKAAAGSIKETMKKVNQKISHSKDQF